MAKPNYTVIKIVPQLYYNGHPVIVNVAFLIILISNHKKNVCQIVKFPTVPAVQNQTFVMNVSLTMF